MFQLERHPGNPILAPNPANAWESLVRTNAGACLDESGRVVMLYRAAGDDEEHRIYLGLAHSDDGFEFTPASDEPVFSPSSDGYDAGCVEDPRLMRLDGWYAFTYASRARPPGRYWLEPEQRLKPEPLPGSFPSALRENLTSTGLALTRDFESFIRCGRVTHPALDDRDVAYFPERIGGDWVMIHRPMSWVGPSYGTDSPAIWINRSPDLVARDFSTSRLLLKAHFPWETKVGGNEPPMRTEHGWLMTYHAVGTDGYYRVGAVLLDLDEPERVTHRTPEPILEPVEPCETEGYYAGGGVVFPCGKVLIDGRLHLYYGGADKHVCLATCSFDQFLDHLLANPWG